MSIYAWIWIFIVQPHKEERFMYVIYPLICYNAAHALNSSENLAKFLCNKKINPSTFQLLIRSTKAVIIALHAIISLARVLAQLRAFSAPMLVYGELNGYSTVCLGKEWYRFPSSFFIPENSEAMFVKSTFDGLLPGRFPASGNLGERSGTWQIPTGMNDRNLEEASHLVTYILIVT
jgi:alpha-1,2-mannosyltransferase